MATNHRLPSVQPGTYALLYSCKKHARVNVGRLGSVRLQPGSYVYVGSALGPGGLPARIAHHRTATSAPHWHIDYLRPHARLEQIWFSYGPERREHEWAAAMQAVLGGEPVPGFGSSDCRCHSHLFFFERLPYCRWFVAGVRRMYHGHPPVHRPECLESKRRCPLPDTLVPAANKRT